MESILKQVQQLVNNRGIVAATEEQVQELSNAISAMSNMTPSVPDSVFTDGSSGKQHFGKGDINEARDGGTLNTAGQGAFYNAQSMSFDSPRGKK
jgi:hypothetical protein